MLKKIALPVVALAVLLMVASAPAQAAVRFGITVGPPVYTYPAPYYQDPYAYGYNNYYSYPAPAYVYPYSYGYSFGGRWDHDRHEWREHERREHEWRDREWRERGEHRR
jgi:hypothetical protein